MLVQFRVKNFTSFKDEACLSFIANTGKENSNNYTSFNKINVLKNLIIYGANASGKTNLIKAFCASIIYIRQSFGFIPNSNIGYMIPFAFSKETVNEPCEFEYIFIVNNIKYVYGFSATQFKVFDEYLLAYYSNKPTEIFSRKNTNIFKFLAEDERELCGYERLALDNKLFLSVLGNTKYEKTTLPFKWFNELIDTYGTRMDEMGFYSNYSFNCYENDKTGELKEFALKLLNSADILIDDYIFETREVPLNPLFGAANMVNPVNKEISIKMKHSIKNGGESSEYYLDFFKAESSGTKILFLLAPILKNAFENGKVLYIDEFENGLHSNLLEAVINLFNNPKYNINNAQLIINTHNTNLLSLNTFRRDQFWFTEKNPNTGESKLYCLDDFSVRKDENIRKSYLIGRYGAIPYMSFGDEFACKKGN